MIVKFYQRKNGKVKGEVECHALNYVLTGNCMGLIELVGSDSAVRAVWAHLMKARLGTSSDQPDRTDVVIHYSGEDRYVYLAPKERYIRKASGESIIICRKGWEPTIRDFFVGGDLETPSPYFLEAFRMKFNNIPVLPEWETVLWKKGIEAKAVDSLESASESYTHFWQLPATHYRQWTEIVKEVATTWHD